MNARQLLADLHYNIYSFLSKNRKLLDIVAVESRVRKPVVKMLYLSTIFASETWSQKQERKRSGLLSFCSSEARGEQTPTVTRYKDGVNQPS